MSATSQSAYKALSIAASVAGGLLASREVLTAAALQGLIFGLVRAAVNRTAARGYHAVTHENPE